MKSLKKSLIVVAALGIAVLGVNLQATSAHKGNISLANLNALSSATDSLECPTLYDLPHAALIHTVSTEEVVSTDEKTLYVFGHKVPGNYVVGKEYSVYIDDLTCQECPKKVCCKTENQRTIIEVL